MLTLVGLADEIIYLITPSEASVLCRKNGIDVTSRQLARWAKIGYLHNIYIKRDRRRHQVYLRLRDFIGVDQCFLFRKPVTQVTQSLSHVDYAREIRQHQESLKRAEQRASRRIGRTVGPSKYDFAGKTRSQFFAEKARQSIADFREAIEKQKT